MKFLLDTAIFLWSLDGGGQMNQRAQKVLESGEDIYLSAASSWEIAIKWSIGKLRLPKPPAQLVPEAMNRLRVHPLPITHSHSLTIAELPPHHKDPFDRLLIAQANVEDVVLISRDTVIA